MTLNEFRTVLLAKSVNRTQLPDDTELKERIFTGLKLIAKETIPLKLLITTAQGYSVLRRLDDELFVKMPVRPAEEDSELDTDESLIDALAYYVMAGLERAKAPVHMGMYHSEIDFNNDRLIETFLSDTTNESDKFQPYV